MRSGFVLCSCILASLFFCAIASTSVQPIWLSPKNVNNADLVNESFSAGRGVWTTIDGGFGSREASIALMDSKGILWILFGSQKLHSDPSVDLFAVWNYNPKTDQYRYVWGGEGTAAGMNPRNPGELRVPDVKNHPGLAFVGTIDNNDNIWLQAAVSAPEIWMFNTTSMVFTRMFGSSGENLDPSIGAVPGQPGEDVWPGYLPGSCMLADSQSNLWMLGGTSNSLGGIVNTVWHFNTTSYLWTFISGNLTVQRPTANETSYLTGISSSACFIDENDRVWLFGGTGNPPVNVIAALVYSANIWTYDTRDKREFELEYTQNTDGQLPQVVSDDYHPDNRPGASIGALFADRKDGTLLVVSGSAMSTSGRISSTDQIWLYNTTLSQWKLVYGNISAVNSPGAFTRYRQVCSEDLAEYPASYAFGRGDGKNMNGEVYIVGGNVRQIGAINSIWLIPKDPSQFPCIIIPPNGSTSDASTITSALFILTLLAHLFV